RSDEAPTWFNGLAGDNTTWRGMFRTSPGITELCCVMIVAPADSVVATRNPRIELKTQRTGSSMQTQFITPIGKRRTPQSSPNEWMIVEQRFRTDIQDESEYYFEFHQHDNGLLGSVAIYEPQINFFEDANPNDPLSDSGVLSAWYATGSDVTDNAVLDLWQTANTRWKHQGQRLFNWCLPSGAARTTTSATYVNVLDSSFTTWSASAPGFKIYPFRRGRMGDPNIPVVCAVYGQATTNNANVQFRRAGATIATVQVTTTLGLHTNTGTIDSRVNSALGSGDKIDVFHNIGAGTQSSVYAMSMWEYEA
ncbi:MAG TPA: hypothetical protein VEJ18_11870, partial [Planctomycetota bacterium]|nr:hypothetical protein [Planctomycetota bacterium]